MINDTPDMNSATLWNAFKAALRSNLMKWHNTEKKRKGEMKN